MSSLDLSSFTPEQLAMLAKAVQAEQNKRPAVLTEEQAKTVNVLKTLTNTWTTIIQSTEIRDAHGTVDVSVSWKNFTDLLNSGYDMSDFVDETRAVIIRVPERIPDGVVKNNGVNQRIGYHIYRRGIKSNKYGLEVSPMM